MSDPGPSGPSCLLTYVPDAFTQYDQTINYYTCTADKHNLHISVKRLHREIFMLNAYFFNTFSRINLLTNIAYYNIYYITFDIRNNYDHRGLSPMKYIYIYTTITDHTRKFYL